LVAAVAAAVKGISMRQAQPGYQGSTAEIFG